MLSEFGQPLHNIYGGHKILQSLAMVEPGEPYEVERTWRERLFTRPWRPWKKTKTVTPMVPMKTAIKMQDGTLIMHPAMAKLLWEAVEKESGDRCSGWIVNKDIG